MIEVDISNVWGAISLPELLEVESRVAAAHEAVMELAPEDSPHRGWKALPHQQEQMLDQIRAAARTICGQSQICVVLGTGGACLGARAAIELLQDPRQDGIPQILFAGNSFSTRRWDRLRRQLEDKDFSLMVISKSGQTLEPDLAMRNLRWLLERKYGTDGANGRITVITREDSPLHQLALQRKWCHFPYPQGVGGRFGVLGCGGLLPMAVAGIDIGQVLQGARRGVERYDLRSFENPVWLYAGVRAALHNSGIAVELLACWEPDLGAFGQWWQQLFAGSEGRDGKGIFPVSVEFPAQLHSLGQMISQGRRNLMETVLSFAPENGDEIPDPQLISDLSGCSLDQVATDACQAAVNLHADGGVPVITVDCGSCTADNLGELFWFMELSCAVSAGTLGVDPAEQPGLQAWQQALAARLGNPRRG